jgi:hypothetical protein
MNKPCDSQWKIYTLKLSDFPDQFDEFNTAIDNYIHLSHGGIRLFWFLRHLLTDLPYCIYHGEFGDPHELIDARLELCFTILDSKPDFDVSPSATPTQHLIRCGGC